MKHVIPALMGVAALIPSLPGVAADASRYRAGEPAVLEGAKERIQTAQVAEEQVLAAFIRAYAAVGRPRMAILWHRDLTDEISSRKKIAGSVMTEPAAAGSGLEAGVQTVTMEFDTGGSGRTASPLPAARDAQFQTGLESALRSAGVRLVDRNTAVRLTALEDVKRGGDAAALDTQAVEMSALVAHSDYFVEISFVPGAANEAPMPRIAVIASVSGEVLADLMPSLQPDGGNANRWVAAERGFVRSEAPDEVMLMADENGFHRAPLKSTGVTEGRVAALALMQRLAESWTSEDGARK